MEKEIYYQLFFQNIEKAIIAFQYDFGGIDDATLLAGQRIDHWPIDATIFVQGKNPTDNLFCPLKPWFVVSKKVSDVLGLANVQGIQLLPVKIKHMSGIEIPGYSILNILEVLNGLHYEKTAWLTPEKWNVQDPELDILKEVLKVEAVKGKDIFRIAEDKTSVYISKFLKDRLHENEATVGFKFLPVEAYP